MRAVSQDDSELTLVGGGRYLLRRELGAGVQGEVHLAHDRDLAVDVAVKLLDDENAELTDGLFEAEVHNHLSGHPNIVALRNVDARSDDGGVVIVSDFWPNGSLADVLAARQPTLIEVAKWGRQAAHALTHAHERDVFHRDLKPSNVLVAGNGDIGLTDFGIATRIDGEDRRIVYPSLAAPELERSGTTVQTETWMLGSFIYRLSCGRYPFEVPPGKYNVDYSSYRAPHTLHPYMPMDFSRVITRALALDPQDRLSSPHALREALGKIPLKSSFQSVEFADDSLAGLWRGRVAAGQVQVSVERRSRGRWEACARLDRGRGFRRVARGGARDSAKLARQNATTIMRRIVRTGVAR